MKTIKKTIAALLAFALCLGMFSLHAFASDKGYGTETDEYFNVDLSENDFEIIEENAEVSGAEAAARPETPDQSATVSVNKKKIPLSSVILKYKEKTYTGKPVTQTKSTVVTAVVNGVTRTLTKGEDYTISYKNNVNVGKATVIVEGKGNYTGTIKKTFKIRAAELKSVKLKYTTMLYTGKKIKMDKSTVVKASVGGETKKLKLKEDYSIKYKNNKKAGTATVIVKGKGNYTGTIKKTFSIIKLPENYSWIRPEMMGMQGASVKLNRDFSFEYMWAKHWGWYADFNGAGTTATPYKGQFTNPERTGKYTFTMDVTSFQYAPFKEYTKNGEKYISVDWAPYDFEEGTQVMICLPGASVDQLPSVKSVVDWGFDYRGIVKDGKVAQGYIVLYDLNNGDGSIYYAEI